MEACTANEFAAIVAKKCDDVFSTNTWEAQIAVDLTKISEVKTAVDVMVSAIGEYQDEFETVRGTSHGKNLMA